MKMKKRIVASLLMMLMIVSSIPVFATNQNPMGVFQTQTSKNTMTSNPALKTIDGLEVHMPGTDKLQRLSKKSSNLVNSVSDAHYVQTKAVADHKASILTDDYGSTSVQYALIDNGKIVLSGNAGVYSRENDKALTADTMYGIGSVSKMFVTAAVMKLVDEGKINLDAPVTEYIKAFKMQDDRYKNITVRMLLNHSSGLMGTYSTNAILLGDNDTYVHDTFLKELETQRLKADPGAYSAYSNDGFTLAEILVEHVTGVSFTTYITNNIVDTLKMSDTKTPVSIFDRGALAQAYYDGVSGALPAENVNSIGPGGVYSSAEDLCTFATTFTQNSNGILSGESIKAMENQEYLRGIWPDDKDNIRGYGLGWDSVNLYPFNQYNIKALSKGGDTALYHGSLIVLPEQNMAIAVVSSGGSSIYNQMMAQEVLLSALKEKGVIRNIIPDKQFTPPQKVAVPLEIKNYEGLYISNSGFIDIKIDETGTLGLSYPETPQYGTQIYEYTEDGTFVSGDGSESLKFVKESNGKMYLQQARYVDFPSLGQTAIDLYIAQKEDVNELTESVSKAWAERDGKKYYLLNEKYSSIIYMFSNPYVQVSLTEGLEGYWGLDKIADENSAVAILDGPGSMSRDQQDYRFYKKDNFEYLSSNGSIYVEEAAITTLSTENEFVCTIGDDGYAKWYKIGDASADKEITVDMPQNAAFVVYDSNGNLVNDSLSTGIKSVKLPQNGTIVFLGSPQAEFVVRYNTVLR